MAEKFRESIVRTLVNTGEMQHVMLSWVRALLAMALIGVACWKEVQGEPVSDTFYMLVGLVVGMYFEKGTALFQRESGEHNPGKNE